MDDVGPVEKIISKLLNGSILMETNLKHPQNLHVFIPVPFVLNDAEIEILEESSKTKRHVVDEDSTDGKFFLTLKAYNFEITFWIGFATLQDAEEARKQVI